MLPDGVWSASCAVSHQLQMGQVSLSQSCHNPLMMTYSTCCIYTRVIQAELGWQVSCSLRSIKSWCIACVHSGCMPSPHVLLEYHVRETQQWQNVSTLWHDMQVGKEATAVGVCLLPGLAACLPGLHAALPGVSCVCLGLCLCLCCSTLRRHVLTAPAPCAISCWIGSLCLELVCGCIQCLALSLIGCLSYSSGSCQLLCPTLYCCASVSCGN